MIGFLSIEKIYIPKKCIELAYKHMRYAGALRVEGVALFAGNDSENTFYVKETIIPLQKAMKFDEGLLYMVEGSELHRINVWLYENHMSLIAQIHSHPGKAYHSSTDDAYPIIATVGGMSIVIPNFAKDEINVQRWAVYRLSGDNEWIELNNKEKEQTIKISDNGFS